jgi:hypothetical protein
VLHVPDGGYLVNATVAGARWYPFSNGWRPATPVFLGIAPSWGAFIAMGWYPGMHCYGGFWCGYPLWAGGIFIATPGLVFWIGGGWCHGWAPYVAYYHGHPGWVHPSYFRRAIYHRAAHPSLSRAPFHGLSRTADHTAFGGAAGRTFRGATGFHSGAYGGAMAHSGSFHGTSGHFGGGAGGHAFGGGAGGGHSFGRGGGAGGDHGR